MPALWQNQWADRSEAGKICECQPWFFMETGLKQLTVTVDGYYVKLTNRIVLSGIFDTTVAALKQYNLSHPEIAHAAIFTNAVNTSNYGVDIVLDYKLNFAHRQHFNALWQPISRNVK